MRDRFTSLSITLIALVALVAAGGTTALAQTTASPWASNVGDTPRIGSNTPIPTAIAVSQLRFEAGAARHAVLSRSDVFADALSGSPLTAEGPLFLTPRDQLHDAVRDEIRRVLPQGAPVYLLGGPSALSSTIEARLREDGFNPQRLYGSDRIQTSRVIAQHVMKLYPESAKKRLLARAFGAGSDQSAAWADSVTGGAYAAEARVPLILSASDHLSSDARSALQGAENVVLLGGTAALSQRVASEADAVAGRVDRASGAARDETAVKIATNLWRKPIGQGRFTILNGYIGAGWAFGLPAAGLAADNDAPLLLVTANDVPPATARAISSCDTKRVHTLVVGGTSVVSDSTLRSVEAHDGRTCPTVWTVSSVTDGDTLRADSKEGAAAIRLAQVDAPETNECYGAEATQALRNLAGVGTTFYLRRPNPPYTDQYGRRVGEIIRDRDRLSVNVSLVRQGFAEWYEEFANEDPDLADRLRNAEAAAKAEGRGLWSACKSDGGGSTGGGSNCHPSYPDVCIPPPPPDLDCGDISHRRFRVVNSPQGYDPHRFDGDRDGIGCES